MVASPTMNERRSAPDSEQRGKERGWRFYLAVFFAVVAGVFVLQNTEDTNVKLLFAEFEMPLFFALLLATLLGIAIGWLTPKVRRDSRRER
jgi:uncharacterized integral membrane protein